jgi:hypothetical protein
MFVPLFCPNRTCAFHAAPAPRFFTRHGSYKPCCRAVAVPRFRCRKCLRTFSRQTFRADYRLKKPWLTVPLWERFVSGTSLRQCARMLRIARRTVEDRLVRFGRHAARLHGRLLAWFAARGRVQLDELETYEHHRILKPLTVAVLLHEGSWFLIDQAVGLLRSRASASARSKARRARFEAEEGRRRNGSREVVRRVLTTLRNSCARGGPRPTLVSDEKGSYVGAVRDLFGVRGLRHERVSGELPRTTWNPLFGINHMEAMLRYGMSRLIRDTFCGSKKGSHLAHHLALHRVWWNCWRWQTNRSRRTPAMAAGVLGRRLEMEELFGWSEAFGERLPLLQDARAA